MPGTQFESICDLTQQDEEFRQLLSYALKRIELSVRARFAYESGLLHGEKAFYLSADQYLDVMKDRDKFLGKLEDDLTRSTTRMIKRYKQNDSLASVPIWVAVELMSFGSVAKMINYFSDTQAATKVAASFSVPWKGFQSTVHSLAVLRNVCAHHGQIWHRKLDVHCPISKKLRPRNLPFDDHGPFAAVLAMKPLMKSIESNDAWFNLVKDFLDKNPIYADGIYNPYPR